MTRKDNEWVGDLFEGSVADCTPASARHTAYMLFAPFSTDPQVTRLCRNVLSWAELETANRFIGDNDRDHFIQRRAFRRFCGARALGQRQAGLSEIAFDETEKGLPYVRDNPELRFSFSSCRFGFVGAWSSTHAIGIDIEDQTRNLEAAELADKFFSEAEAEIVRQARDLARVRSFFQLWSLKESALKSVGEGLPFGLDAFEFTLHPNLRMVRAPLEYGGPDQFSAHVVPGTSVCAALVARSTV